MGLRERLAARRLRRGNRPPANIEPAGERAVVIPEDQPTRAWPADQVNVLHHDPGPRQAVNVNVRPEPAVEQPVLTREAYVYETSTGLDKAIQAVWLLVGFFEVMLAIRFLLRLLGANPENPFAVFTYGLTDPLTWPFMTLLATPQAGAATFEWFTIFAMVVYWLIGWLFTRLLVLIFDRPPRHYHHPY